MAKRSFREVEQEVELAKKRGKSSGITASSSASTNGTNKKTFGEVSRQVLEDRGAPYKTSNTSTTTQQQQNSIRQQEQAKNRQALAGALALAKNGGSLTNETTSIPMLSAGNTASKSTSSNANGTSALSSLPAATPYELATGSTDPVRQLVYAQSQKKTDKQKTRETAHAALDALPEGAKEDIETLLDTKTSWISNVASRMSGTENILGNKKSKYNRELNEINKDSVDESTVSGMLQSKYGLSKEQADYFQKNWSSITGIIDSEDAENAEQELVDRYGDEAYRLVKKYNENMDAYRSYGSNAGLTGMTPSASIQQGFLGAAEAAKEELQEKYGLTADDLATFSSIVEKRTNAEETEARNEQIEEFIAEHPVAGSITMSAADILTSPIAGPMAVLGTLSGQDTNSNLYALQNMATTTESAVNETYNKWVDKKTKKNGWSDSAANTAKNVGNFLYGTGMSTAKSGISMLLGGKIASVAGASGKQAETIAKLVTLPSFGASAFASSLKDELEKGIGEKEAYSTAIANGLNEMLFEELSLDSIYSRFKKAGNTTGRTVIKNLLIQSGIEGVEEVSTDLANSIADSFINGAFSDYQTEVREYMEEGMSEADAKKKANVNYLENLGTDFLGGALGGLAHGAVASVANNIHIKNAGASLNLAENSKQKAQLLEAAKQLGQDTTAYQLAMQTNADSLTDREMGQILQSVQESNEVQIADILTEELVSRGDNERQARKTAETMVQMASEPSEQVSVIDNAKRVRQFEGSNSAAEVYANFLQGEYDERMTANAALREVETILSDTHETAEGAEDNYADGNEEVKWETEGKNAEVAPVQKLETGGMESNSQRADKNTKTSVQGSTMTYAGTDRKISNRRDIKKVDATMDGSRVQVAGFSNSTSDASKITVLEADGNESTATLAQVTLPDNVKALYYAAQGLGDTYAANAAVNDYQGEAVSLYNMAVKTAYYTGRAGQFTYERFKELPHNAAIFAAVNEPALREIFVLGHNAYEREQSGRKKEKSKTAKKTSERRGRTSGNFRGLEKTAELHAKKTGVDIESRKDVEHNANGYFAPATMKIVLNENRNLFQTLMHETNEFADTFNPEGMKAVYDSVIEWMATERGASYLASMGSSYLERYNKIGTGETFRGALEELSNDVIGAMFSTDEGIREYVEWLTEESGLNQKERKGIIETIVDFFQTLYDSIKDFVDNHNLARNTEMQLSDSAEKIRHIREKVLEEWDRAIDNSQFELPENITSVKEFSLSIDEDGIENYTTSEETKRLTREQRKKQILKIMEEEFRGRTAKFSKNGQVYYAEYEKNGINKGVYGDTKSDKKGFKAKINIGADGNYIELAENALYHHSSKEYGKENKYHRDAEYWDYYVKTIKCDGDYFNIFINVKSALDKRKYVYEIVVKKTNSLPVHLSTYDGNKFASGNSITPNSKNATDNYEKDNSRDIRYSMEIDEAWEAVMNGEAGDLMIQDKSYDFAKGIQYSDLPKILEEGYEALQNARVDDKAVRRIAHNLIREYSSTYDEETFAENIQRVFAYIQENGNLQFADLYRVMKEVAEPMVEQSRTYDPKEQQLYRDFRDTFKGRTFRVSQQQADYLEYMYGEAFHKIAFRYSSRFKMSKAEGEDLDGSYETLIGDSGYILDMVTPEEEAYAVTEMLESLRPQPHMNSGANTMEQAYDAALDIFGRFFEEQAKTEENAKAGGRKYAQELSRARKLIREKNELRLKAQVRQIREQEAEKRREQAEYYQEKLENAKKSRAAALAAKDKQAYEKYQKMEKAYEKKLETANRNRSETIERLIARNRITAKTIHENQERAHTKEQIRKNAGAIVSYFNENTDKKHVAEWLKDPVARFVTAIDFTGAADSIAAQEWEMSLRQMRDRLSNRQEAQQSGYEDVYNALHGFGEGQESEVLKDMQDFLEIYSGAKITELSTESLKQLNSILRALRAGITRANRLFVNQRTQSAQELGRETIRELEEMKDKKSHGKAVNAALNLLDAGMMDSRTYFYQMGSAGLSIYQGLREAFNQRVWKLKDAQTYMEETMKGIDAKDWTGDRAKVHKFVIDGKELKLTTAQIMSIYELRKRNQALIHMLHGGIKTTQIGKGRNAITRVKPLNHMTEFDLDNITSVLTAEQKRVADAMQQFMQNKCSEWGNDMTMLMYGYKRYGATNYFPISVDGNSVDTKDDTKFFGLKNMGFTKKTMKNAGNALIVGDIFDVFAKHVSDMASYSTFTAPLVDAMKWYNFRDMDYSEEIAVNNGAVKTEIDRVYGHDYLEYFEKLIKDINAESSNDFTDSVSRMLVSNMKAASVGANIRVAIQQPTAIFRAMAVMNPKYLAKAVAGKSYMKKSQENSAITQWKSWGYFETSIGRSMKDVITGQGTLKDELVEKSMTLAQLGDDVTWGYLWKACELETSDRHRELEYESPEYIEAVAKRFDEVVDQTQVVDSVLHRSHIMRNQNGAVQMATAYMAEPTKSYNLLMNGLRDALRGRKGAKKHLARVAAAYTITSFVNAIAQAVMDAVRDDDDEDEEGNKRTYLDKMEQYIRENFADNMNPAGIIPYAKDFISIMQGYDVNRMDMQALSNFVSGAQNTMKWLKNEEDSNGKTYREKKTFFQSFRGLMQGASQLVGIPVYNAIRDVGAFYHTLTGKTMGGEAYTRSERYEMMVEAYKEGNTEIYEEEMQILLDFGADADTIKSGVTAEFKQQYIDGKVSKSTLKKYLLSTGLDEDKAEKKILEYKYGTKRKELKKGLQEGTVSEDTYAKYLMDTYGMEEDEAVYNAIKAKYGETSEYAAVWNAVDNAIAESSDSNREAVYTEVKRLTNLGKKKESILSTLKKHYGDAYVTAKEQGKAADMQNILVSALMTAGYTRKEAMEKVNSWKKTEDK